MKKLFNIILVMFSLNLHSNENLDEEIIKDIDLIQELELIKNIEDVKLYNPLLIEEERISLESVK